MSLSESPYDTPEPKQAPSEIKPTLHPALMTLMAVYKEIYTIFRSVQFAVICISLLGLGTLIGVITPQEGNVDATEIQKQFGLHYPFLRTLGFFNVFSSFWFITLEVLFFFSLLIGSFKWLKPAYLAATQVAYLPISLMSQKPLSHSIVRPMTGTANECLTEVTTQLKKQRYTVHTDTENKQIYATKGHFMRLGPVIAHIGILLCLVASVHGAFTGFKAIKMAVPGETFNITQSNTFKTNTPMSVWLGSIPTWTISLHSFKIDYYKDHPETAKNYYSDLQISSEDGTPIKRETISVNHPLNYDDITIYQSSFAPTGKFWVSVDGQKNLLSLNRQFNDRQVAEASLSDGSILIMFPFFANQDPGITETHAVFFVEDPKHPSPQGVMPANINLGIGKTGTLKGHTIKYIEPQMSSGFQIKRAPEVPLMYLYYLIIGIGTVMCVFSQRQVWATLTPYADDSNRWTLTMTPKTNKARLAFQRELFQLHLALLPDLKATILQSINTTNASASRVEKPMEATS